MVSKVRSSPRMVTFQMPSPEQFDFTQQEWPRWIWHFKYFSNTSELSKTDESYQINVLIYCMGDTADSILPHCHWQLMRKVYKTVKEKLEAHFVKKWNVIYEYLKFNWRIQQEGESADSFITALHCLAEHCNYGTLHSKMIHDRSLLDASLSTKLQFDP